MRGIIELLVNGHFQKLVLPMVLVESGNLQGLCWFQIRGQIEDIWLDFSSKEDFCQWIVI